MPQTGVFRGLRFSDVVQLISTGPNCSDPGERCNGGPTGPVARCIFASEKGHGLRATCPDHATFRRQLTPSTCKRARSAAAGSRCADVALISRETAAPKSSIQASTALINAQAARIGLQDVSAERSQEDRVTVLAEARFRGGPFRSIVADLSKSLSVTPYAQRPGVRFARRVRMRMPPLPQTCSAINMSRAPRWTNHATPGSSRVTGLFPADGTVSPTSATAREDSGSLPARRTRSIPDDQLAWTSSR